MHRGIQISLMVFGAVAASGGVLTESSTCSIPGTTVMAAAGCSLGSGFPSAGVLFGVTNSGPSGFAGSLGVHADVGTSGGSSASGSLTFVESLYTPGPMRPGYIVISGILSGFEDDGGSGGAVTPLIGPYEFFPPVNNGEPLPIELGTELTYQVAMSASVLAGQVFDNQGGDVVLAFAISFFEADGITPVAALEAPEPAGGLLCCVGLGLIGAIRRVRS